jgi:cytochrome P450
MSVQQFELPGLGATWLITGYDEGRAALADARLSRETRHAPDELRLQVERHQADRGMGRSMLDFDPPDHTRLRQLVRKAFTPRRVEGLRPRVQEITDELLDGMASAGEVDLVDAFAFPLPVKVICELLGLPVSDRDQFRAWTARLTAPYFADEEKALANAAGQAMRAYFEDLLASTEPEDAPEDAQPDLTRALLLSELDREELVSMLMLLLIAGHETTVNLIGNGMAALFAHPDQLRLLRERPELVPGAVEELLRFDGPLQSALPRVAVEEVEISGVTIPAGGVVNIVLPAANRDKAKFDDPDRLDLTRTDNQHLAFGHGIHFCLGAPLARLEGQVAFRALVTRFPDLAPAVPAEEFQWRAGGMIRGLLDLPVRFTPQPPAAPRG